MKKVFPLIIIISLFLFLFISAGDVVAGDEGCNGVGGQCRIQCLTDEENWGANPDLCDQFGQAPRYCCVPKGTPKKSCGESCIDSDECPPECPACQEQVQGQGKVCRVAGPIESAPPGTGCEDQDAIPTAIGCINVKSPEGFVNSILTLAIGLAGGIAMLLIIFGGIQILTSAGNPDKIQAGKELITSAIAGLILIVFSVFILRIIGVEILDIF